MGITYFKEPKLEDPVLLASWPGIGNIGVIAINTLRGVLVSEELAEVEPWDFFYPRRVLIRSGEIKDLTFPTSKFYFKRTEKKDLIFFIGEEQPSPTGSPYADGAKAYRLANLVLDVAERFGCKRVYTSGAAVAPIHHTMISRVWAVPNFRRLIPGTRLYANTILMSDIEGREGQGNISGLNGLLLGVAKKRGLEAICVMGEIPVYLQGFPIPYPKASKAVLDMLCVALGITADLSEIEALLGPGEREIDRLYETFPPEIREQLDKLKLVRAGEAAEPGPITEEDKKRLLDDIDRFFKPQGKED
ncbi:MAG: PAC2 family protein [Chloroflexi bacterium]|nr:PAC2 family protein [Chloroflexota bacterium]